MAQQTYTISQEHQPTLGRLRLVRVDAGKPAVVNLINQSNTIADLVDVTSQGTGDEQILMGPYDYLKSRPGKDIRSRLIDAFDSWLQISTSSLVVIKNVVGMLHTASLLIDDIQDDSKLRRGAPSAHIAYGIAQTINSANYVYFQVLQELSALNNPDLVKIYTAELLNLHRGQGMELSWRDAGNCPTELQYLEMAGNKTGGLFRFAIRCIYAESRSIIPASKYIRLANMVGLLFQILDDYRNLTDGLYTKEKGLCEDLTEGKFSFPIIHAIQSNPESTFLYDILKQRTEDEAVKMDALSYLEKCGSFSYTRNVLRRLTEETLTLVDEVDAGRGRSHLLKGIIGKLTAAICGNSM